MTIVAHQKSLLAGLIYREWPAGNSQVAGRFACGIRQQRAAVNEFLTLKTITTQMPSRSFEIWDFLFQRAAPLFIWGSLLREGWPIVYSIYSCKSRPKIQLFACARRRKIAFYISKDGSWCPDAQNV